jgi:hypothetical protein
LDRESWRLSFERAWESLRVRYFQFERLQDYQEPESPSYRAFRAGDLALSRQAMVDETLADEPLYTALCQKGVPYIRAHAIERPLTDYLKWELETYRSLARYGQRILLLHLAKADSNGPVARAYDFLLFDDHTVMVQDYGADGILCGGWITKEPELVRQFSALARQIESTAMPLAVFERAEGRLSNSSTWL